MPKQTHIHVHQYIHIQWYPCYVHAHTVHIIGSILRHYGIDYHIYADDTQLYIKFDLSDPSID